MQGQGPASEALTAQSLKPVAAKGQQAQLQVRHQTRQQGEIASRSCLHTYGLQPLRQQLQCTR